jgi:hypothetical protein
MLVVFTVRNWKVSFSRPRRYICSISFFKVICLGCVSNFSAARSCHLGNKSWVTTLVAQGKANYIFTQNRLCILVFVYREAI